jgi:hypothetical protein
VQLSLLELPFSTGDNGHPSTISQGPTNEKTYLQIQGRLTSVKDARNSYHTQLTEVKSSIEAEKLARPESVGANFQSPSWLLNPLVGSPLQIT